MKISSVFDKSFSTYGQVISGYDTKSIVDVLKSSTPLPNGVEYVPSENALEQLPIKQQLQNNAYGGMPIQMGWCNGHNTKLNCLEYHRDSEINLGTEDFILLLAKQEHIHNNVLDTSCVEAFCCPANTMIEVFATSLHYAPCCAKNGTGFRVMIVLPKNTNLEKPTIQPLNDEDKRLWALNKWLLAHSESSEALEGAHIGLIGENIDIEHII